MYQLYLPYQIWGWFLFVNPKSLNQHLILFQLQITFWICVGMLWIYKVYFVFEKLVLNVGKKSLLLFSDDNSDSVQTPFLIHPEVIIDIYQIILTIYRASQKTIVSFSYNPFKALLNKF